MPNLNWEIIGCNVAEPREQLQQIEARINGNDLPDPVEFQIMMQHAFHHLNFAWNARTISTERYARLSQDEFDLYGRLPDDLGFDNS